MTRLFVRIALTLVLAAGAAPSWAAEDGKAHAVVVSDGGFDLVPVAVPVIVGKRVMNYVFVTVHLAPTSLDKTAKLKTKEAFLRDALVRAAHKTPFTLPTDYNRVDEARISATMLAASTSIVGPGQIRSVSVSKQQPKNIRRSPKPAST